MKKNNQTCVIFITCSILALGACASTKTAIVDGALGPSAALGVAVKANIAAQAVPVLRAEKYNTYIPADRKRQADAQQRYVSGNVEAPVQANTRGTD